jgi:hypothetical protein
LTRLYGKDGVYANSVMPGGIQTDIVSKNLTKEEQVKFDFIDENGNPTSKVKSKEQGAATSVWAAVAPELENKGGLYLENCSIAQPLLDTQMYTGYLPYALDPFNAKRLWEISENWLRNPPKKS